ncbi:MAG: M23 family metallopeptidase [Anaerovoracaceae bacterium]|jgi:murein DD-endopeptidase MepM/ murein hydrolase activator NlpD
MHFFILQNSVSQRQAPDFALSASQGGYENCRSASFDDNDGRRRPGYFTNRMTAVFLSLLVGLAMLVTGFPVNVMAETGDAGSASAVTENSQPASVGRSGDAATGNAGPAGGEDGISAAASSAAATSQNSANGGSAQTGGTPTADLNAAAVQNKFVTTRIQGASPMLVRVRFDKAPCDYIKVTHPQHRLLKLQEKTSSGWKTVKSYRLAKGSRTDRLKIRYPGSFRNKVKTAYRLHVSALTVKNTDTKVIYSVASVRTKTVCERFLWPLKNRRRITSSYGARYCPFHGREFHSGVDIAAPTGTKIHAAASGTVISAARVPSFGKRVIIRHGKEKKVYTWYNHMNRISVKKGQKVERGQVIGRVGSTGDATGPHLDFRIYRGSRSLSPLKYTSRH